MMHQEVGFEPQLVVPVPIGPPHQIKRRALQRYFAAIGFNTPEGVFDKISENGAEFIGQQLYLLTRMEQVSVQLYDSVAEELYMRAETRQFSLNRMFTLVSLALGYSSYLEAREVFAKHRGKLHVRLKGQLELAAFRTADDNSLPLRKS